MKHCDPRLLEFVRLFNTRKFYEAHEILEELWLETHGKQKQYYKGLIQCAVAFAHFQRGNIRGASALHARSSAHLSEFLPHCEGIDLSKLKKDVDRFFKVLADKPDSRAARLPVIRWVPQTSRASN